MPLKVSFHNAGKRPYRNTFKEFTKGEHYEIDVETGCWEWLKGKIGSGYGQIQYKGKSWRTHRLSYTLYKNKIPKGKLVLHSCHNRACINPKHLRTGTHKENTSDMIKANRQAKGEDHGRCKLTDQQVIEIRKLYSTGDYYQREIAEKYGVSREQISYIVNNKSRKQ